MLVSAESSASHTLDDMIERRDTESADEIVYDEEPEPERESISELSEELYKRFSYEYPYAYATELPEKMSVSRITPAVLDNNENEALLLFDEETSEGDSVLPEFITGDSQKESARRGVATHCFMQFFDIEGLERNGAKSELERLVRDGFLSDKDKERVRIREIEQFTRSKLFSDMRSAKRLYREFRFNTELDARLFTENEDKRIAYSGKTVLVQGVIDCIVEYDDGSIGLFDYKTDRLTREELSDRALAAARMKETHGRQLYYYSLAIERIFGRKPVKTEVYSLALGDSLDVSIE
jgi:ATP-dependent helicase/nuclease subunit A